MLTAKYKALVVFDRPKLMEVGSNELAAHTSFIIEKFGNTTSSQSAAEEEDAALCVFGAGFEIQATAKPKKMAEEDPEIQNDED